MDPVTTEIIERCLIGQDEVSTDALATQLGLPLTDPVRRNLGAQLKRLGFVKARVRRGGELAWMWQRRTVSQLERDLRKLLKGKQRVTVEECCYAMSMVPDRESRSAVVALLKRWRWRREPIVAGRLEWARATTARDDQAAVKSPG